MGSSRRPSVANCCATCESPRSTKHQRHSGDRPRDAQAETLRRRRADPRDRRHGARAPKAPRSSRACAKPVRGFREREPFHGERRAARGAGRRHALSSAVRASARRNPARQGRGVGAPRRIAIARFSPTISRRGAGPRESRDGGGGVHARRRRGRWRRSRPAVVAVTNKRRHAPARERAKDRLLRR